MNFWKRLFSGSKQQARGLDEYMAYMTGVGMGGVKTIIVNPKTAHKIGVVMDCIDVITRTLTLVSPKIIEQRPDGKYIAGNHPLYTIINSEPYPTTDASRFYASLAADYLLWGNAYAIIKRGINGQPTGLKRIEPDKVEPYILDLEGVENHWYKINGEKKPYNQRDVIHLMDYSFDGIKGISRIQLKKSSLQDAAAIQNYSLDMYSGGLTINGLLKVDPSRVQNKDTINYVEQKLNERFAASSGGVKALPAGFDYVPLNNNLAFADAQVLEAKKFATEDIARIFGVPLSLIGRGESADNKADREFNTFLATTIAPLTITIENELNRKLLNAGYYVKFELKGLYRADMLTRYQAHQVALAHGFMNKDEVRDAEGMNPIPGGLGRTYFQQINTIPLDQAMTYYELQKTMTNDTAADKPGDT